MATFIGTTGDDIADATTGTLTGFTGGTVAELQDSTGDTFIGRPSTGAADGADSIVAGSGDDNMRGLAGNDTLNGGGGIDEVRYDRDSASGGVAGVNVNLATGLATDGFGNTDTLFNIEQIRGTNAVDTLTGGASANGADIGEIRTGFESYRGLGGNDIISGGAGFDEVRHDQDAANGGAGAVIVNLSGTTQFGVAANSALDGFGNTDSLTSIEGARGTTGNDTLIGSAGDNSFSGFGGNDSIVGGNGFDTVRYDVGGATGGINVNLATGVALDGTGGTDQLSSIEHVRGTGFNDTMTGSDDVDNFGDSFTGYFGADVISGGLGFDEVRYDGDVDYGGTGGAVVNLSSTTQLGVAAGTARDGFGTIDTLTGIENARGTIFVDSFFGNDFANSFVGLAGNDTLNGGAGSDTANYLRDYLDGGTGAVIVNLSSTTQFGIAAGTARDGFGNNDTLIDIENARGTYGNDTLIGGAADNGFAGFSGNDLMFGDAGSNDEVRYDLDHREGGTAGVTVNFANGTATDGWGNTDTISGFEIARGTRHADSFIGSGNDETFRGLAGNDVIDGAGGFDFVSYSRDIFEREEGQSLSGVIVNLSASTQFGVAAGTALDSFGNTDTLISIENVGGGTLADRFIGNSGENIFRGFVGNDTLDGGAGFDIADYSQDASYGTLIFQNGAGGINVDLVAGTATDGFGNTDALISIEGAAGGAANDIFLGNSANNGFLGGLGTNSLTGGGGRDAAIYEIASSAATIVRNANGTVTISGAGFSDTLTGMETAVFTDKTVALFEPAATDLTGDGTSDIVWHNASNGATNYFRMANGAFGSWEYAGFVDPTWSAISSGDLDGNGSSDVLFRRADGAIGYLASSAGGGFSWQGAGLVNTAWSVIDTGDLNGDGQAEIVYTSASLGGAVGYFDLATNTWNGLGAVNTAWTAIGVADTDGDTEDDIVYYNQSIGQVGTLDVNAAFQGIGSAVGSSWSAVATGDFNGDGSSDILMQNASLGGALNYWATSSTGGAAAWSGFSGLGPIGNDWAVAGTGNYNGDAYTDILLYSATLGAAGVLAPTSGGGMTWTGLGAVNTGWQIV